MELSVEELRIKVRLMAQETISRKPRLERLTAISVRLLRESERLKKLGL
jgi:hypothetical protein